MNDRAIRIYQLTHSKKEYENLIDNYNKMTEKKIKLWRKENKKNIKTSKKKGI